MKGNRVLEREVAEGLESENLGKGKLPWEPMLLAKKTLMGGG